MKNLLKETLGYLVQHQLEPTPANFTHAYRCVEAGSPSQALTISKCEISLFSGLLEVFKEAIPEDPALQRTVSQTQSELGSIDDVRQQLLFGQRAVQQLAAASATAVKQRADVTQQFRQSVTQVLIEIERGAHELGQSSESALPAYADRLSKCTTLADATALVSELSAHVGALTQSVQQTASSLRDVQQRLAQTNSELTATRGTLAQVEAQAAAHLESAHTDPLSGLLNRRGLESAIQRLPAGPASVLVLDIDNFKKINDTLGHPVGDIVIKGLAQSLKAVVRGGDLVARVGGEELLFVLPGAQAKDASRIAERFLAALRGWSDTPEAKEHGLKVTASGGLSFWTNNPSNALAMVKNATDVADRLLYKAKEAGKDRIFAPGDV